MSNNLARFLAVFLSIMVVPAGFLWADEEEPNMSKEAVLVGHDDSVFKPDPEYPAEYNAEAQQEIYGGKYPVKTQRPLLEIGRKLYHYGPFQPSAKFLGAENPASPQLLIFGDLRTAVAYNANAGEDVGLWASQLNLDVDLKLTSTERLHAFFQPLSKDQRNTRCEFSGSASSDECELESSFEPLTYFFEGDLGAIVGGIIGRQSPFDLPFAAGKIPLLFQNGIWVEDAFLGAAFSIPARNSRVLDISNFDLTFFAGLEDVTSGALEAAADDGEGQIFGMIAFVEALQGYFEAGYGYTRDRKEICSRDYHNMALSFTRRYGRSISNSVRVIGNFGQNATRFADDLTAAAECRMLRVNGETANGFMVLLENSFITRRPSHVVPYLNLFYGHDQPQALARNQGLLKNTGILFESDALTGFPFLEDSGAFTHGGALGIEVLGPRFNWQVVLEVATVMEHDEQASVTRQDGIGLRVQIPLTNAILVRINGMAAQVKDQEDLRGATLELRHKF